MRGTRSTRTCTDAEFIWHDSPISAKSTPSFSRRLFLRRLSALRRHRAFSPVMNAVKKFAAEGGLVLGICNGFQILVEAGLLPGALAAQSGSEIHLPRRRDCAPKPPTRHSLRSCQKGQVLAASDRARRGPLFCRRAHARSSSKPKTAWRSGMSTIPNGSIARYRRHSEPRTQRDGHDAASGARLRSADGLHRRPRDAGIFRSLGHAVELRPVSADSRA